MNILQLEDFNICFKIFHLECSCLVKSRLSPPSYACLCNLPLILVQIHTLVDQNHRIWSYQLNIDHLLKSLFYHKGDQYVLRCSPLLSNFPIDHKPYSSDNIIMPIWLFCAHIYWKIAQFSDIFIVWHGLTVHEYYDLNLQCIWVVIPILYYTYIFFIVLF